MRQDWLLLVAALLWGLSVWWGKASFDEVAQLRQLEQLPPVTAAAVVPGETHLSGTVVPYELLYAPDSGASCVYYTYKLEKKTGSGDNQRWTTLKSEHRGTRFALSDATGRLDVVPMGAFRLAIPVTRERREGRLRHQERCLRPGWEVTVVGSVADVDGKPVLRFDLPGNYDAMISTAGELDERSSMGLWSVWLCWLSVVAGVFGLGIVVNRLGIRRVVFHYAWISVATSAQLALFGLWMIQSDLADGARMLEARHEAVWQRLHQRLGDAGVAWDGTWPDLERALAEAPEPVDDLDQIRHDLAWMAHQVQLHRESFPERLLAASYPCEPCETLPTHANEDPDIARRERAWQATTLGLGNLFVGFGVGLPLLVLGANRGSKPLGDKRYLENIPTTPTAAAFAGAMEVKGEAALAEGATAVVGPLSRTPCVYVRHRTWQSKRSGKHDGWKLLSDTVTQAELGCDDGDGFLRILPAGALVHMAKSSTRREGGVKEQEDRIEVGETLYAIGHCVPHGAPDGGPALRASQHGLPFVLSTLPEDELVRRYALHATTWFNLCLAAVLAMILALAGRSGFFGADDYLAAALVPLVLLVTTGVVLHWLDVTFLTERVQDSWKLIEAELARGAESLDRTRSLGGGAVDLELTSLLVHEWDALQRAAERVETSGSALDRHDLRLAQFLDQLDAAGLGSGLAHQTVKLHLDELRACRKHHDANMALFRDRTRRFPDNLISSLRGAGACLREG